MTARKVAGILLAGGTSSRMGENKLLLEIAGETVLRRSVRAGLDAALEPMLVVLGHDSERARAQLQGMACVPVDNPRYQQGMNTSVSAGASALPDSSDAAVVMLGDMPFVSAGMIRAVVAAWREEPLVVSLYGEVIAPPVLYARALFAERRALPPTGRGKQIVERHRHEAAEVRFAASALQDLDVPADVQRARARFAR